jgi:hypothetical protein
MPRPKHLPPGHLKMLVDLWIPRVNAQLPNFNTGERAWEPHEYANARKIVIDTTSDEVLSALRFRYFEKGWTVFAIQNGGRWGHAMEMYLEFWPKPRLEI